MPVYVDQPIFPFRGQMYCHVWADTLDELHAAAQAAGLKHAWFQRPPKASWDHYDASPGVRAKLLAAGAVETDKYGAAEFVAHQEGNQAMVDRIARCRAKGFGWPTGRRPGPAATVPAEPVLRALSILQPWAWLIVNGHKVIENRNWKPWNPGLKFRGPLLIHAGLGFDDDGLDFARDMGVDLPLDHDSYDRGGIVGRAVLADVVTAHASPWFFGPYGLVLADAEPLPFRRCRGMLGFFTPAFDAAPQPATAKAAQTRPTDRQGALDL